MAVNGMALLFHEAKHPKKGFASTLRWDSEMAGVIIPPSEIQERDFPAFPVNSTSRALCGQFVRIVADFEPAANSLIRFLDRAAWWC